MMIDPLTALAAVKTGIAAGKSIMNMSKEISGFFDSVDAAKKQHQKKKNSVFASANEQAMDTWMQKQQAEEAEIALRELITATRGYSAYQDLLKIRRDTLRERKEQERREALEAEARQEQIFMIAFGIIGFIATIVIASTVVKRMGLL
jgi:hypothetical protein